MKFIETKQEKTFEPVTLVVETRDELLCLWHRLNMAKPIFDSNYKEYATRCSKPSAPMPGDGGTDGMWNAVDRAARVRGIK